MSQSVKLYRDDLDLLKGFAIIAVVLYHMGISSCGYLGVDVFFAINGFLIMPKVIREVADGRFSFVSFLEKRIVRLLPLLLLVSACSLLVGYWGMLPDDYENLSSSVVASNFFSNNILAAITTADYWDIVNDYKALMHTWYIGILFEPELEFNLKSILDNASTNKTIVVCSDGTILSDKFYFFQPGDGVFIDLGGLSYMEI